MTCIRPEKTRPLLSCMYQINVVILSFKGHPSHPRAHARLCGHPIPDSLLRRTDFRSMAWVQVVECRLSLRRASNTVKKLERLRDAPGRGLISFFAHW